MASKNRSRSKAPEMSSEIRAIPHQVEMSNSRITGVVKTWREDKQYGFIALSDREPDLFFHVSQTNGRCPVVGDVVEFAIGKGDDGRRCAKSVRCISQDRAVADYTIDLISLALNSGP
jgi:cold shock CspA family protein